MATLDDDSPVFLPTQAVKDLDEGVATVPTTTLPSRNVRLILGDPEEAFPEELAMPDQAAQTQPSSSRTPSVLPAPAP